MNKYELELTYYEFGNLKFKLLENNIASKDKHMILYV